MRNIVIIGAGINGVCIARKLAEYKDFQVIIIDKENSAGYHASTRNSGVIHAGFYYSPDTKKAKLCAKSNKRLRDYCVANNIPTKRCGKVVVATNEAEIQTLEDLEKRGKINGCKVEIKESAEIGNFEKYAKTVGKFLWSPNTWSTSPQDVMNMLVAEAKAKNVKFKLGEQVTQIDSTFIKLKTGDTINYDYLVNASGGEALKIYKELEKEKILKVMPFKGLYLKSIKERYEFKTHIYPVPNQKYPFLGIHTTLTSDDFLKLGPTAIPALSNTNYSLIDGLNEESLNVAITFASCMLQNNFNFRDLAIDEMGNYIKTNIIRKAERITTAQLNAIEFKWNIPGIRAQLYNSKERKLVNDFIVRKHNNSIHLLNSISPAWTCALETADNIVKQILEDIE